ncbi:MAG: NAD(P)/FAD-dependent oxidoreductase [Ruthenibacterium sp.]
MYDVIIIGCGVVGAATAYQLAKYRLRTLVLEAQNDVANGTTKANSAIIHAGYDPEPGTQMARLNVQGNRMAGEICEKLGVPFARVGSLVLAFCEAERQTLETLFQRGQANGVPACAFDGPGPAPWSRTSAKPQAALYAPSAGIVDPWRFALMAETAVEMRSCACKALSPPLTKRRAAFACRCAAPMKRAMCSTPPGCRQTRCRPAGSAGYAITPSRGEYYPMDKSQRAGGAHYLSMPQPVARACWWRPPCTATHCGPHAEPVRINGRWPTGAGLAYVRKTALAACRAEFPRKHPQFCGPARRQHTDDFILESGQPWLSTWRASNRPAYQRPGHWRPGGAVAAPKGVALEEKPVAKGAAPLFCSAERRRENALI